MSVNQQIIEVMDDCIVFIKHNPQVLDYHKYALREVALVVGMVWGTSLNSQTFISKNVATASLEPCW